MNKSHFYYKATLNFSNLNVLSFWSPRSSQVDRGAETDNIMWIEHIAQWSHVLICELAGPKTCCPFMHYDHLQQRKPVGTDT